MKKGKIILSIITIIGGIVSGFVLLPKVIRNGAACLYKYQNKHRKYNEDDIGPEIIKKEK